MGLEETGNQVCGWDLGYQLACNVATIQYILSQENGNAYWPKAYKTMSLGPVLIALKIGNGVIRQKNAICLKKAEKTRKWTLSRAPGKNKAPQTPS